MTLVTGDALLRSGRTIDDVLDQLGLLRRQLQNARTTGPEFSMTQSAYIQWVETIAEPTLRALFRSEGYWRGLHSDRYWRVRSLVTHQDPRPFDALYAEMTVQDDRLTRLIGGFTEARSQLASGADSTALLLDTNAFVHYRRFEEVDWTAVADVKEVRLVVPLLVVDELDDLSFRSNPMSDRAKGILKKFQDIQGSAAHPEAAVAVRKDVTLQFLMEPRNHARSSNHDDDFLDSAEFVTALTAGKARVVSADYGMRLRCRVRGLEAVAMPAELLLASR